MTVKKRQFSKNMIVGKKNKEILEKEYLNGILKFDN